MLLLILGSEIVFSYYLCLIICIEKNFRQFESTAMTPPSGVKRKTASQEKYGYIQTSLSRAWKAARRPDTYHAWVASEAGRQVRVEAGARFDREQGVRRRMDEGEEGDLALVT